MDGNLLGQYNLIPQQSIFYKVANLYKSVRCESYKAITKKQQHCPRPNPVALTSTLT